MCECENVDLQQFSPAKSMVKGQVLSVFFERQTKQMTKDGMHCITLTFSRLPIARCSAFSNIETNQSDHTTKKANTRDTARSGLLTTISCILQNLHLAVYLPVCLLYVEQHCQQCVNAKGNLK